MPSIFFFLKPLIPHMISLHCQCPTWLAADNAGLIWQYTSLAYSCLPWIWIWTQPRRLCAGFEWLSSNPYQALDLQTIRWCGNWCLWWAVVSCRGALTNCLVVLSIAVSERIVFWLRLAALWNTPHMHCYMHYIYALSSHHVRNSCHSALCCKSLPSARLCMRPTGKEAELLRGNIFMTQYMNCKLLSFEVWATSWKEVTMSSQDVYQDSIQGHERCVIPCK